MKFTCPNCKSKINGSEKHIGKTVPCPSCKEKFLIKAPQKKAKAKEETFSFRCPECFKDYNLSLKHAGKTTKCTACESEIRIPNPNGEKKEEPKKTNELRDQEDSKKNKSLRPSRTTHLQRKSSQRTKKSSGRSPSSRTKEKNNSEVIVNESSVVINIEEKSGAKVMAVYIFAGLMTLFTVLAVSAKGFDGLVNSAHPPKDKKEQTPKPKKKNKKNKQKRA